MMNQMERMCRPYLEEISCFKLKIPNRFDSSETIDGYCSVNFPSGYSIYVEEFFLEQTSPDNFVLLDGKPLEYSSKLKWENRRQKFWEELNQGHPLKKESNLRSSHRCVNSLKVQNSTVVECPSVPHTSQSNMSVPHKIDSFSALTIRQFHTNLCVLHKSVSSKPIRQFFVELTDF